jgi:tetratricopeptide (TPR) repeat protein
MHSPAPVCGSPTIRLTLLALLTLILVAAPRSSRAHSDADHQIGHVDSLLSVSPMDAALLRHRAELLRIEGEFQGAMESLDLAERAAPGNAFNRLIRAQVRLDLGDHDAAMIDADAAVLALPDAPDAWRLRAEIHARRGDHARAVEDLDRAIMLQAAPRPEHYLERARQMTALGDDARALEGLDAAAKKYGPLVALEHEAIAIELRMGRADAALARFDRLASTYARPEAVLIERGDLLMRAGRAPAAIAAWTEALSIVEARATPAPRDDVTAAGARARLARAANHAGLEP